MYTIATAAAAVGRAKTAIQRLIDSGRLTVSQADTGEVQIDPAELHRIYPPLHKDGTRPLFHQSPLLTPVGE